MSQNQTVEQRAYSKPRAYRSPDQVTACGLSSVDCRAKILINNIEHAGMAAHICALAKEPYHDVCKCACGATWARNVK